MTNIYDQFDEPAGNPYDQFEGVSLPGGGIRADQGRQTIPGLDPNRQGRAAPDARTAAVEKEAANLPRTLGGQLARDVPRTARGMAQGATLGYSDEALALARALATDETYNQALADERAELDKLGGARLPAEVVGSLPLAGKLVGRFVGPGTTTLGRAGRGAAVAGGTGTVYGFGSGEGGFENRAGSAAIGGAGGAVFGGGIPVLGRAGQATFRAVTDRMNAWFGGRQGRLSAAARQVAARIIKANPDITPQEALEQTRQELLALGKAGRLGDVNDELQGLLGATARAGGAPGQTIKSRLRTRQEGTRDPETEVLQGGQVGRTEAKLDELSPENPRVMGGELARHDDTTRQFYDDAYAANQQMDSPELRRILQTPAVRRVLKQISESFRNTGRKVSKTDPELTALVRELEDIGKMAETKTGAGIGRGMKLEALDLIKRELDFLASKGKGNQIPKIAREGRDAGVLAGQLRRELDRLDETGKAGPKSLKAEGGEYARARARAKQRIEARKALQSGEHFLLKSKYRNDDELKAVLDEMSPEERHAFRVNAIQTLKDKAAGTKATHDVTKHLKGDRALERKIKLVFGDLDTWRNYIRFMNAEERMFKTYAKVFRGSETAERLEEGARLRAGPSGNEVIQMGASGARGNLGSLAVQASQVMARSIGNMLTRARVPENVRREIAEYLTGPQGLRELEAALQQRGTIPARRAGDGAPRQAFPELRTPR